MGFAFLCAVFTTNVAQAYSAPGRLIVQRIPNYGWNLAFNLQIDGMPAGSVAQGHRFDGWLPPGQHVLTVSKVPHVGYVAPTSIVVNVRPGWGYVFTAMWDSGVVFLRGPVVLSPGEIWQLRP